MHGLHLTADLNGCRRDALAMVDADALRALCLGAADAAGLTPVGESFHKFADHDGEPRGVTGVLLLAESHLAVHTWPELDAVTLDVYVCHRHADNSARAEVTLAALLAAFAPRRVVRHAVQRGTRA